MPGLRGADGRHRVTQRHWAHFGLPSVGTAWPHGDVLSPSVQCLFSILGSGCESVFLVKATTQHTGAWHRESCARAHACEVHTCRRPSVGLGPPGSRARSRHAPAAVPRARRGPRLPRLGPRGLRNCALPAQSWGTIRSLHFIFLLAHCSANCRNIL